MLLFMDGFEYPTADLDKRWSIVRQDGSASLTCISGGRVGQRLYLGTNSSGGVQKIITPSNVVIVGFALKYVQTASTATMPLVTFLTSSGTISQGTLTINGGVLTYSNGTRNTYSLASLVPVSANVWHYIEFKLTMASSAVVSTTQVRLNGVVVIDVPAGTNTIGDNSFNTTLAGSVRFGATGTGVTVGLSYYFDDLYICNGLGSYNNNFLGDCKIETIRPDGAVTSGFTPLAGSNWGSVSEVTEDGDTSYVASNVPTTKDIYSYSNLASSPGTIFGLQISTLGRKDDAGTRILAPIIKTGGTEYQSTNTYGLADGYTQHLDVWERNPNGAVAWTTSTINSINAGFKIV